MSTKHGRNIQQIRAIQDDNDEEELFEEFSVEEELYTNATNPALVRNKMKMYPKSTLTGPKRRRR